MVKTFTRADVLSWRPCHGAAGTRRIMRGLPRRMTAIDVLRHNAASPEDRLWCVLRQEALSDRTLRLFAAWCARGALDAERAAGREPDARSWAAVETAERYALGRATGCDLRAAYDAAYDAARDAVHDAYGGARAAAACEAACAASAAYAAYDAAYDAARAAYDAAFSSADACAAYAAARAAQVERLIEENEK